MENPSDSQTEGEPKNQSIRYYNTQTPNTHRNKKPNTYNIHTCQHTIQIHIYKDTYIYTYTGVYKHIYLIHTHILYIHAFTQKHTHIHTPTQEHGYISTFISYTHIYI